MRRVVTAWLLLFGFGCAPGTGPDGLQCITSEDIDPMKRQPRFDPYSANEFFADRRAMRQPPLGAVARTSPDPGDPRVTGFSEGSPVRRIPVPLSRDLFVQGRKHFDIFCAPCHGLAADGDSVVARQMQLRPPPSLLETRYRTLADGDLYRVVSQGYGLMPSYQSELEPNERWAVVAYVRALQRSQGVALSEAPPDVRARVLGETKP